MTVCVYKFYWFYFLTKSSTAFAGIKVVMSHLPGGRQHCVIPYGMWVPVAVRLIASCYTPFTSTFTAENLNVESYTVFICQQSYLLLSGISSPTHSFIPGLKPPFSANPSHCSPSFFFFRIHYMDSAPPPTVYCYFWAHLFSTFSFFSVFTLFSCRFRAVDWADSCRLSSAR